MIYFENTYYIYLFALIPALIAIYIVCRIRRKKIDTSFGDSKLINKLVNRPYYYIHPFKFLILLLSVIFLVLALSNPYRPLEKQDSGLLPQTDIVFAVDVSKSMLAADVLPNRLLQAQNLILNILGKLHGEQVAIVVFAGKADLYIPLTSNYDFVKTAVKNIANDLIEKQGTSINDALKISSIVLSSKNNDTRIIGLITDGETSEPDLGKTVDSISKKGANLFAFGLGTQGGAQIIQQNRNTNKLVPLKKNGAIVISQLHSENLLRVVNNHPERYYQLTDKDLATNNFLSAIQNISQHNKKNLVFTHKSYFQLFLLIALFLLILEIFI